MTIVLIPLILAFGIGLGLWASRVLARLQNQATIKDAEEEAERLLAEAKAVLEDEMAEARERAEETEQRIIAQNQKEISQLEERVKEQDQKFRNKRSAGDRGFHQDNRDLQREQQRLADREKALQRRQAKYDEIKHQYREHKQQMIKQLAHVSQLDVEQVKTHLLADLENSLQIDAKKKANQFEEDIKLQAEELAKEILSNALSRFPRESCLERGIGVVELTGPEEKEKLFGNDRLIMKKLEELCGVDVALGENGNLQVSGYDPVRREINTRCLEKIVAERQQLTPQLIEKIFEKTKREVFQKIDNDGTRVAKELGMQTLHPEIKYMLGCLRYRYSFAQNQHYHVAEVGWLCGLLATELKGVDPFKAKRSGLLHDIGKAMDHSIDGGHAVIGADFIKERGETDEVVHAVRSHHYEEQPSSDLAFLVIAADAISGARPGARRSTVTVYNQKIEALSTIGEGFPGVTRTLVFNAGREVRILVDPAKVNDEQSLVLCRDIASKIENECTYPGQIRVVVVREAHAQAVAK